MSVNYKCRLDAGHVGEHDTHQLEQLQDKNFNPSGDTGTCYYTEQVEFVPDPEFLKQLEAEEDAELDAFEAEIEEFYKLASKSHFPGQTRVHVEDMDVAFLKSLKAEGYLLPGLTFKKTEVEVMDDVEPEQESLALMPSSAMASSRLGDIYAEQFEPNGWPLDLALPALVTAASVLVPRITPAEGGLVVGDDAMTNLYTALIAPVHAGKSQAIEWAAKSLGIYREGRGAHYYELKSGSAEQLLSNIDKYSRNTFQFGSVLINPDEWAHLFAKAGIPDASFPTVLTTSFYRRKQTFTMARNKEINLNLSMSFIGGIVEDDFDTVFNAQTLGGLYDRFLFGKSPDGFKWDYQPYPFDALTECPFKPVRVRQDASLFEVIKSWNKKDPELGRVVEICTRVATIFAAMDGRPEIDGNDLERLEGLAQYQKAIRSQFRPNAGVTSDAQFANAALGWIERHAQQWVSVSLLKRRLYRYQEKLGPNVAERALFSLAKGGDIDLWIRDGRSQLPADYKGKTFRVGLVRKCR
jgi:hypothetical protein